MVISAKVAAFTEASDSGQVLACHFYVILKLTIQVNFKRLGPKDTGTTSYSALLRHLQDGLEIKPVPVGTSQWLPGTCHWGGVPCDAQRTTGVVDCEGSSHKLVFVTSH